MMDCDCEYSYLITFATEARKDRKQPASDKIQVALGLEPRIFVLLTN